MLGDLVAVARNRIAGGRGPRESAYAALPIQPMGDVLSRYHISLDVDDRAGVLAAVAGAFAEAGVSISTVPSGGAAATMRSLVVVTHSAPDAALARTVDTAGGAGRGELGDLGDAGDGRPAMTGAARPRRSVARSDRAGWPGLIAAYSGPRRRCRRRPGRHPARGRHPAGPAPTRCPSGRRAQVYLKVEGANPTGSFKDRGMTVAVTHALASGARAVICASTGNTSASAAAYAARAGLTSAVLVPQGKIAAGKLAQAVAYGARILQIEGNFDDCLELARKTAASSTDEIALVNSVNPVRIEGQKTAAFEICDVLGRAPDVHCLPVGNAGNITAYWKGYREYARRRRRRVDCRGCSASRRPARRRSCWDSPSASRTRSRPPSGSARPASWAGAIDARDSSGGLIDAVTDEQILAAYRLLATTEGVFVEPASAASVAGLLRHRRGRAAAGRFAGGVHGDRQRAEGSRTPRMTFMTDADGAAGRGRGGHRRAGLTG